MKGLEGTKRKKAAGEFAQAMLLLYTVLDVEARRTGDPLLPF